MKKTIFSFGFLLLVGIAAGENVARIVDPFLGTRWPGATTPAATYPLGMVQPGPDVGREYRSLPSGYQAGSTYVMGFTQNHLSGTGCCDLQDYLVKPFTGDVPSEPGTIADETAEF